jgi:hypothetical protein
MNALAAFFGDYLAFLLVFRALSRPPPRVSTAIRTTIGVIVVFVATLATLWWSFDPWALLAVPAAAAVASMGVEGEGLARLTGAFGSLRLPIYLLAVATLSALVLVFIPITTFLTSPGELSINLNYLLSVNAHEAVVFVYVAAAVYAFALTQRMRTAITLIAVGALALALVYSYALPIGYPRMSGLVFEQIPISRGAVIVRAAVDLVVVFGLGLALRLALLRWGAKPFLIAMLLVDLSLGTVAAVSVTRDRLGAAGGQNSAAVFQRPLRFSATHPNVLIIFLDRFMGSYVESILESDPGLAQRLSGFTWYPRSVSSGENSIAGVHGMLGGYDYIPVQMDTRGKPLRDLSTEAFSILPYNFSRKGYHVNMVNPKGLGFTMDGDCKFLVMKDVTCSHIPAAVSERRALAMGFPLNDLSKSSYVNLLVLLGAVRAAPYSLKEIVLSRGSWQRFMDHSAGTTFREWAELEAFPQLSDTHAAESNFNFVDNILPHESYFMGEDCRPRTTRFAASDEEAQRRGQASLFALQHSIGARCALLATADYMDFLKSAGVYDNTKIVIVSDHGIVGPVEDHSTRAVSGGTQDDAYVRTRSVLLVKDIGASGPLRTSEQFMPNAEVPRIVCEQIGGCINPYLGGRTIAAHGRDDPFYVSIVPWQFNLQNPDSFVIDEQWVLRGKDPYAASDWQRLR